VGVRESLDAIVALGHGKGVLSRSTSFSRTSWADHYHCYYCRCLILADVVVSNGLVGTVNGEGAGGIVLVSGFPEIS